MKAYILSKLENTFSKDSSASILAILNDDVPNFEVLPKEEVDSILDRIINGEPTQYVSGIAPFYGYFFGVDKNVLIPRPETEELVYAVEKYIKKNELHSSRILDIGTGSGCIPITINKLFPKTRVVGLDASDGALSVARANNLKLGTKVSFQNLNFLEESKWPAIGQFDIIISNPPYIPHQEKGLMSSTVLDYEPHLALFVEDANPLIFYRKIFHFAERKSNAKAIFMECNEFNAKEVNSLFEPKFVTEIIKDLQGKDRILKAQRIDSK